MYNTSYKTGVVGGVQFILYSKLQAYASVMNTASDVKNHGWVIFD